MAGRPQRRIPQSVEGIGRTDTLTVGAKKALGNFIDDYGNRGVEVFKAKAVDHGTGNTLRQKVNSIYKKGGTVR
jgi:hypothetical protein